MQLREYKKLAGTSAVFVSTDHRGSSPIERDGLVWKEDELGIDGLSHVLRWMPPLDNVLALEGLEDYDPPKAGDARYINSLHCAFVFVEKIRGWVELTHYR